MTPIETMSRDFYGYGQWNAPYWFIGPEPGGEGNETRAAAFSKLGKEGLCDCKEFHREIGVTQWHREPPEKTALQPTWRRLMLLLMPTIKLRTDRSVLKEYQCRRWGQLNGETCVIELGGLSAKSVRYPIDRDTFRKERTEFIRRQLEHCNPVPKLVVMYGAGAKDAWKDISSFEFVSGTVSQRGETLFAFMQSPTAFGQKDLAWISLGERLAEQY